MVERIPDDGMSTGRGLKAEKVPGVKLHHPNPKTFHYEAHCVIHEPLKFDEDLTGCHLIIDKLAGIEYILPVNGRQRTVHFILENAVLAVIEPDDRKRQYTMTKGQLKNYVDGMLNAELKDLQNDDPLTEEVVDNVEIAFTAILERARDEEDTCEDEDEESADQNQRAEEENPTE